MLVSFRVRNFRSFAEEQTLSLVAGSGAAKESRFSFPSDNTTTPYLLRSSCLFGPNGAGKSSLVMAMAFFKEFVISSAKDGQEGEKIDVHPFFFDEHWRGQPTEFEVIFIHGDALYQYGFVVDEKRVLSEWMFTNPHDPDTKFRTLFQREYDAAEGTYAWKISKTHIRGEKEVWKTTTRDNALFLSTSVQLNAEAFKTPFDWIQNFLRIIESPQRLSPGFTAKQCLDAGWKDRILRFLRSVDVNIEDIYVKVTDPIDVEKLVFTHDAEDARDKIIKKLKNMKRIDVELSHKGKQGDLVSLALRDESDGSQVIFSIAGPWLDVLDNGYTLVVDELHNSLHPHAFRFLVDLFHNPIINNKRAQLIFTSHETSIMEKSFMHRDQICLVEKNNHEQSQLIPLSEYKEGNIDSFRKSYLDGRYGAVPMLKDFIDG
ncbi:MAG: ATPase AAA core protein [Magnetococcales bacterium]|nr:ATPase AAA core protein [Magnetococcales bacterium]HIJ84197.1 ATP-binding protein [Magnetococcales bacterium]